MKIVGALTDIRFPIARSLPQISVREPPTIYRSSTHEDNAPVTTENVESNMTTVFVLSKILFMSLPNFTEYLKLIPA